MRDSPRPAMASRMNSPKRSLSHTGTIDSAYSSPTFKLDMSIKVDAPVGAMSISPCSRDVVLASRHGLHIVDLDNPYDPPRFLQHLTAWSVADVQWSPHASHAHWVVSTSNQKAIVWNLALPSHRAIELVLNQHSRAITDINFSAHEPTQLATCSIDSFVHCWDLRTPRRPAMTFCDWFAGATQVKYNRQNPHILASAHDRYLYVWDTRMGAREVRKINAHSTKIYGIDWNRTRPTGIVTCALDKTVKFWDYEYAPNDTPERIIHTSSPVWRARHTPFGWGVLTMPQRRDTALYLWDRRAKQETRDEPVAKFEGHTDQVKEFLWRSRGGENPENCDDREFQLVTWGLDRDIRLWYVDKSILEKVGHNPKKKMRFRVTRRGAKYLTFRDEAAIVKQYTEALKEAEATKQTPRPILTIDGARIASRGGQKDGFSNGQEKGILATGIQRQISQANLREDNGSGRFERALIGVCEGGYMRARRKRQAEMNPITWMRGVKIARKVSENNAGLNASKTSARSGDFGFSWDFPENLGDEISFVGSKFPKIKFEKVNIATRTCTVSLTGPWGASCQGIFVRADVSFPQDYPSDGKSIPEFMLEKTNSISDENITTIDAQLRRIALALVAKKRMCLEACLCYLLGERTDDAALMDSNDGGDSSTDDEAIVNSGRNVDEEEGISSLISNANQASVPLPKACGALWAPDGRLVCFFPPKEERIGKGLLSSLAVREGERAMRAPGGGRLWEGFGRLFMDSPIKRGRNDTNAEFDSSDSSYTSDETSDDDTDIRSGPLGPGLGWRLQGDSALSRRFRRGGSTDRSTQRSTGTGVKTTITATAKRKSIVAIHDMTHILPAKRELADQYVIGEGAQVCKHNAEVAEKYGYRDLADVWRLVEMVLCNDVPLEIYNSPKNRLGDWGETIMVLARRASLERRRRDSGLGLEYDQKEDNAPISASDLEFWGPVKWGGHPMGGQWLIEQLFGYFEKKADVQMLAMLSCILCEGDAGSGNEELHTGTNTLGNVVRRTSFSRDYFPNIEMIQSLPSTYSISPSHHSASMTPIGATAGSYSSSGGGHFGSSDPLLPYSTGTTPPTSSMHLAPDDYPGAGLSSVSSSPEAHHYFRRTTFNNLSRAFGPVNASPPSRKRPSPAADSLLSPFSGQVVTWGAITTFGSGGKDSIPASTTTTETSSLSETVVPIYITMTNSNLFDDEAVVSVPLLSPHKYALYRGYRENYANLLFNWDLQIQRLEILHFNPLFPSEAPDSTTLLPGFNRRTGQDEEESCEGGLEVAGLCSKCGSVLDVTQGAKGECKGCKRRQTSMKCVVCERVVKGLYAMCLKCGHVAHGECHRGWFGGGEEETCPAGCGCVCLRPLREDEKVAVSVVRAAGGVGVGVGAEEEWGW